jgi:hypothetical protein
MGRRKVVRPTHHNRHVLIVLFPAPTPVFFFSHGSTMMLGEDSEPAKIWEAAGTEALRRGVKRIVMMVRDCILTLSYTALL